jgi:transcriptional regulator with XRE-family HTH domain
LRRNMLGLSQSELGEAIGLTFQQVQKYECGANRISASRLLEIAQVLGVPIAFFYDDVDPVRAPPISRNFAEGATDKESDHLQREETSELVIAYYDISDPRIRRCLFELARALAETTGSISEGTARAPRRRSPPARNQALG